MVSWDTASTQKETSDYSVGTVWGAKGLDYYLLEVDRGRPETPELRRRIMTISERYGADATLMENTELGRSLTQDLKHSASLRLLLQTPWFDKEARIMAQSARFEGGQVHLPRDASWLGPYVDEILAFPVGKHDDQVDSTSQALSYLTFRAPRPDPPAHQARARPNPTRKRMRPQGSLIET